MCRVPCVLYVIICLKISTPYFRFIGHYNTSVITVVVTCYPPVQREIYNIFINNFIIAYFFFYEFLVVLYGFETTEYICHLVFHLVHAILLSYIGRPFNTYVNINKSSMPGCKS